MSDVDEHDQRPPHLFNFGSQPPPADAWDLQVPAAPTVVAWCQQRAAQGRPATLSFTTAGYVRNFIRNSLPRVSNDYAPCYREEPGGYPHTHMFVAPVDIDGRTVERATLQAIADDAFTYALDQTVAATGRSISLGHLRWDRHGIVGVDDTDIGEFSCTKFAPRPAVVSLEG